jgi:diguanylate cyclase (GGDEF)-like protein
VLRHRRLAYFRPPCARIADDGRGGLHCEPQRTVSPIMGRHRRGRARLGPGGEASSDRLLTRLDDGRRARLLTALCLSGAGLHLAVIAVQALLHGMQPGGLAVRLALDAVLLIAPLVRRWTSSVRVAALLVGSAVAIALPVIALRSGGLSAPMLVIVPLVPLLMATFVGKGGTVFIGAALAAGMALVMAVGGGGPSGVHDAAIRLAILIACVGISVVTACLHERERESMVNALGALAATLEEESTHDSLTKLFNRRYLDDRLAAEMAFARRHGTNLSVVVLDVDYFKRVNDEYGHAAGDDVLVEVAHRLRRCVRAEDVVARSGGEEFVVLLRATDVDACCVAAERMRHAVAAAPVRLQTFEVPITVSAGCASMMQSHATSARALLEAADARLYAAKKAGRNRVMSSDSHGAATFVRKVVAASA